MILSELTKLVSGVQKNGLPSAETGGSELKMLSPERKSFDSEHPCKSEHIVLKIAYGED